MYFIIDVTDDTLVADSGTSWWDDDCIEWFLDGNYSRGTSYDGVDDFQLGFVQRSGSVRTGYHSVPRTTGIRLGSQATAGGYVVEFSIPWATIGVTPGIGSLLGLDVRVDDDDDGATRDALLGWYSGIYEVWEIPSGWGTLELCGPL
jgi:hypothetical protein